MTNALIIDKKDNVVVAIEEVRSGDTVTYLLEGTPVSLTAAEDITIFHKLASCDIPKGQPVIKYGEYIGYAACDIKKGQHVHVHNVASPDRSTASERS